MVVHLDSPPPPHWPFRLAPIFSSYLFDWKKTLRCGHSAISYQGKLGLSVAGCVIYQDIRFEIGLINALVVRAFKINNTNSDFRKDLDNLTETLKRNTFPSHIIDKTIKRYLDKCIFFGFKDPLPDGLKSLVVYQCTCAGCNSHYIFETSRHSYFLKQDKRAHW